MTLDEARKVAEVISEADSGCPVCVSQLVDLMQERFPGFDWVALVNEVTDGFFVMLESGEGSESDEGT